ncbi:DNA-binding response regulator [Bifidobacterium ramosum]|nr:response regulator transcription factor [Bifidobacterium ramosum]KAB8287420.1 DNA-binding response regulator [Bifidobacterium ramosum]
MNSGLRVGIVDDDPMTLAALRTLINGRLRKHDICVIWATRSGTVAVDRCVAVATRPDAVLVDMGMDDVDGEETCRRIRHVCERITIFAMTAHSLNHYRDAALRSGACTLLDKADIDAMEQFLIDRSQGRIPMQCRSKDSVDVQTDDHDNGSVPLSAKEIEVMDLTITGLTAKEVAGRLGVSESTIKTHIRHVIIKLGVRNKLQAISVWSTIRRPLS